MRPHLISSILVQFMVFLVFYILDYQLIFGYFEAREYISHGLTVFFSSWTASIIFTIFFFRSKWREMWFVDCLDNKYLLAGPHGLVKAKLPETDAERIEYARIAKGAREIHPGLDGIWPTEYIFACVNKESEIIIGATKDKPKEVVSKDNKTYYVQWQVKLTPLPGYLVNLVTHDEEAIKEFFEGECNKFLDRWFSTMTWQEFENQGDQELTKAFQNLFGGKDTLHPLEKEYGVFTNDPQIVDIDWNKELARAVQAEAIATSLGQAIEKMIVGFRDGPKPSPDVLLTLAGAAAGVVGNITPVMLVSSEETPKDLFKAFAAQKGAK